jgi:hypothetical protein
MGNIRSANNNQQKIKVFNNQKVYVLIITDM